MDLLIRIAGEAGQGVQTTGNLLVSALAEMGLHVFAIQSYLSRIRGGLNWFDVRIGDAPLYAGREQADVLVALTDQALATLRPHVTDGGAALFDADPDADDTKASEGCLCIPLTDIAKETGGSAVMANAVAAGAVFGLLGYDLSALTDYFATAFKKKGKETIEANVRCAQAGADRIGEAAGSLDAPQPSGQAVSVGNGTEGVGLAAAAAGVKFVTAYPMTPATGVLTYLAGVADDYGIVVEQAEDEIAAVNMVCGATYAGVPAMTTTSGGGFALMAEGLSLAGMMELPAVVLLAQRPGPATGLPTRTGQEDLAFALHAGHGEFPRALFAPGTPAQAYELTRRALKTAHRFQTPVIVLIDQFLADVQKNTQPLDRSLRPIDRHVVLDPAPDYVRYAVTGDGVSPRALPGSGPFVVCDSDEHTEDGHITEDLGVRVRLQDKRLAKVKGMTAEALPPEVYGPTDPGARGDECPARPESLPRANSTRPPQPPGAAGAETLLVAWGSTYGPCREAVDILAAEGRSVALVHFAQVWPLDAGAVRPLLTGAGAKRVISVEGNSTGQFASILRGAGAIDTCDRLLRYDGMPLTGEWIAERILR